MPRTFSSPRAARRYAAAHAIEIYGDEIEKAILAGNRVISVPRGAARAIAERLSLATEGGPGWVVQVSDAPNDPNVLTLRLSDALEGQPTAEIDAPPPALPDAIEPATAN